jgi:cytochrome c556
MPLRTLALSLLIGLLAAGAALSAGQTTDSGATTHVVGSMSDLMVKIIYPTSDAIFYITTRTPKTDAEWNDLEGKALMLAESANLLTMPGRARDQDRWLKDTALLLDAGTAAFRAARRRDVEALAGLNQALYTSCVTCHQDYRPNFGRR